MGDIIATIKNTITIDLKVNSKYPRGDTLLDSILNFENKETFSTVQVKVYLSKSTFWINNSSALKNKNTYIPEKILLIIRSKYHRW